MKRATEKSELPRGFKIISIHALVKRATVLLFRQGRRVNISIHALVKRATHSGTVCNLLHSISIHALVKRATIYLSH